MIQLIINNFKNLEKKIYKIMKIGIRFSFLLTIISCIILLTYTFINSNPNTYYIGLALFKLSIYYIIYFIICALVIDTLKKGT